MTDKEFVFDTMRKYGKIAAQQVQSNSANMTGTELNAEVDYIPSFKSAVAKDNMLNRKAGQVDGFVCKSSAGRVVKLIQNYDSETYTQEPEELPAQWRFVWSTNPKHALPFIELATSPYATNDCCTYSGHVWRSGQDGNVWAPGSVGVKWDDLGTIEEVMSGNISIPETPVGPGDTQDPQYDEWVRPSGAHDAYNTGDIVSYNGKLYKSKIDNNTWAPDEYAAGWEEYTEV